MRWNVRSIRCGSWLVLGVLAACSGGGGGSASDVEALSAPEQISLLEADDTGLDTGSLIGGSGAPGADAPPDSDYLTDVTRVHVFDPSMQPLALINTILCYVSMTAYGEMLNRGDYEAQIDVRLCENGDDGGGSDGQSSGQSSSAQAAEFMLFTVNSARASQTSDHVVRFWVPEEEATIRARMTITEGASEANPFGAFHLDYVGVPEGSAETDAEMYGALATFDDGGASGFAMFENEGDLDVPHTEPDMFSRRVSVALAADPDANAGAARIRVDARMSTFLGDSGVVSQTWRVAYDATHFKRQQEGGDEQTFSRTQFTNSAWRYNLYHAQGEELGERVELNSGFGFRTEDGHYGWIGYHGLWAPGDVVIEDGDTIVATTPEGDGAAYTVVRAPGKLIRHLRSTLALAELEGNRFHWWDHEEGRNFLLDYAAGSFNKIAYFDDVEGGWVPIEPPEAIDVAAEGGFLHMWSETLGGSVSYVDGDSFVTYFAQEFVNGSSALFDGVTGDHVTLLGFVQCLDAGITGAEAEAGDVYLPDAPDLATPYLFRFDKSDLTLRWDVAGDGSTLLPVGLADGEAPEFGPFTWGMMSGPLLLDTAGISNLWEIWGAEEFYTYETGHNSWNRYAAAVDALGASVTFDAPLQFLYTHSQASDLNDDDEHDGAKLFLSYGGPGDLWGIPHEGSDLDGDGSEDRWYPVFSIRPGTLVGPTGTEYLVRPIEIEQTLLEDAAGGAGLDLSDADALELPDETLHSPPGIGEMPEVSGPPAVVNGVVVGG